MAQQGQYLKKTLIGPTGHSNECWRAVRGVIDILSKEGTITLLGYNNGQNCVDGKVAADQKTKVMDVTQFASWEAFYADIATYLCTTDPEFQGGSIEMLPTPTTNPVSDPTPTPDPDPIPDPDPTPALG